MDNLDNGLELLSGKLVVLFLTYALALEACVNFPAGTRVKVTNDPNPDLNGEYTWDGTKLVKTTNNTLEKAKDEAEKLVEDKLETVLTPDKILDIISGQITEGDLDTHLRQRIDKIESVGPIIDELQREADKVKKDLDEQLFFLEVDYNNLKKYVTELELEVNIDFAGVKEQIQQLRDQVAADMAAAQKRIDEIQAEIDTKWQEVDQIQLDLQKEINDRIDAVRAETEARVAEIRKLSDGLTQEIIDRKDGDQKLYENIENYKVSNEQSLANIREEVKVAVDTANASAEKVDALDARVKVAEDNSGKALENSAAAVSKAQAAADLAGATATRVDSLEADVIKAVDDSGTAIKNSATALQQSQAAVDKANAVAESVNIVEAKLNTKNSTYRQDTAPTKADTPNLTAGDIWINPSNKNEQKRWNGVAWVDISDMRIGDNASAIEKLTATVSDQGGQIKANADKITNLETTIGDMATSDALEALRTEVKKNTDGISGNAEKITALETTVGKNQEANSKALQDLNTRVDKTDEKVAANASAITSLNSTVNASLNAVNITADLDLDHDVTYFRKFGEINKVSADEGTTQRVIRVGNNAGNDVLWMHPNTFMPFDPDVMYKVRAKIRRNSGTGTIYIGVAAKNAVKTKYVTTTNTLADDMGSSHYFLTGSTVSTTPVGQWVELEWYIKGRSTGSSLLPPTYGVIDKPIQLAKYVGYITPMFIANYGDAAGQVDVAYVVLETAEAYKMISANANALTSLKTDVQKNADGIKAVGEAVTNVESSITNMDIGGQNLWSIWNKTLTQPVTGGPYIKVDWLEGQENDEWYRATIIKDMANYQHYFINVLVDQRYPIVIGEEYTVTFEMRASKIAKIYQVLAYFGALSTVVDNQQSTTTDWKTYTFTAKANGTNTAGSYQLFGFTLLKSEGWNLNDWYEVRRVQLQKGNKATRYQKAQAGLLAGIKANSQAFSTLNATVQEHADTISSQGQAITGLESKVNGIDGEVKANAKAVDELKTTVIEQGDEIRSQGQAITSLDNTVKISAKAGTNLLINSNVTGTYDGVGYPHVIYNLGEDFEVGVQYSLIWCAEHKRGTGDTNSSLAVYAGGGSQSLQSLVNTNGKVINRITFVKSSANLSPKNLNFYMINRPPASAGSVGTVYWAVLVKGPSVLTDVWIPSPYDYIPQATANANAITGLQTDVKANGDSIKIQAEQLTGVKATLGAHDTDSLALDYNTATPSVWESYYSYDMKQYFKTTTSGKIGPNVFRKDTTNPANCFNFNLSKIPNNRPYKVSFWARRSADSTGRFEIPVRYVRADGSVSNVGGGYGAYPITPAIPNNEVWTFVEMVIDASKVADAPQIQFGIALGHTGTSGWSEMQGYKVSPVLNAGDMDATVATAEAVQKISTQVDKNTKGIETQGIAITGLESKVNDIDKAVGGQATAIDELKTSVKTQGDTIAAQGQSITKVEAGLKVATKGITMSASIDVEPDSEWIYVTKSGEVARANDQSALGGKVYRLGNNAGNDHVNMRSVAKIPFNPQRFYTVKLRYRRVQGTGTVYASVLTIAADGVSHVKPDNSISTDFGGSNYFVINQAAPLGVWQEAVVYVKGRAAGAAAGSWTMDSPRQVPANTAFLSLQFLANYPNLAGVVDLDYILIEESDATLENNVTAKAVSALTTEVEKVDGKVTAQATDISNLKVSVNNIEKGKADVSALDALKVDVKSNTDNIKIQAEKVTGLESNLDGVRLSTGQNLIWNGDFTSTPNGLENWGQNGNVAGFQLYNWAARGTKWARYVSSDTTTAYKGFRQVVPISRGLKPNMDYTLSWDAHGNYQDFNGKTMAIIIHRQGTSSGTNQVGSSGYATPAGIQRHSYTFNTNGITDLSYLNIIFYVPLGFAPDFFVTNVQLEEGKVGTGFKKSNSEMLSGISANAQAVTQLKTLTETQGNAITSQGQSITDIKVRINDMEKDNLLNPFTDATGGGAIYEQVAIPLKKPIVIKAGEKYTVRGKLSFEHPNALADGQGIGIYLEGSPIFSSIPRFKQGADQTFEGTVTIDAATNGRTISNLKFYLLPSGTAVAGTKTTVHWAELFKGDSILGGTASAVQSLSATVKQQGEDITSQGQAITQLNSSVKDIQDNKADASALNNYYTKAQADSALASSLTELKSGIVVAGNNMIKNGNFTKDMLYWNQWGTGSTNTIETVDAAKRVKIVPTTATGWKGISQATTSGSYRRNTSYTVSFTAFSSSATSKVRVLLHSVGGGNNDPQHSTIINVTNKSSRYSFTFKTTDLLGKTGFNLMIGPDGGISDTIYLQDIMLSEGDVAAAWSDSNEETQIGIAANTTAIGKVETRTATLEGTVETQGTDIRALKSQVNDPVKGLDATAIAMGKLDTRVKTAEDSISLQGKAITQVEASISGLTVGGRNYLLDSKTQGTKNWSPDFDIQQFTGQTAAMSFDIEITTAVAAGTRNRIGYECSFNQGTSVRYMGVWLNNASSYPAGTKMRVKNLFAIPAGTVTTKPTNFPFINQTSGGAFKVSNVKWEVGNLATDWTPAPEDVPEIDTSQFASAKALNDLSIKVDNVDGKVTATADSVTQLESTVGDNTASLKTQGQSIDGLMTKWSVKADVNGMVSGVAMNNDGKTADFIIRANTFAIAPPTTANAGNVGKYAFVYQSTPKTLPNGTVIPAGLYVDSLMLGEINANRINANSLSAISANLGTLVTYKDPTQPTKARMVMQGSLISVYDDNNKLRVRLGLW
ncbi:tail protein [Acinetobacter phage vB_AbaM_KissB]